MFFFHILSVSGDLMNILYASERIHRFIWNITRWLQMYFQIYLQYITGLKPNLMPYSELVHSWFKSLFAYKIRLYFIIKRNSFPWYKKIFKQILIHPLPIKNLNLKVWNERKAYEHSRLDISFHFRLLMKKQCIFCRNPTKNKNVSTFSFW